jgi:hypothetical protein
MIGEHGRVKSAAVRDEEYLLKVLAQDFACDDIDQRLCATMIKRT